MSELEKLAGFIQAYNKDRDSWDAAALQNFRDDISSTFFLCANELATVRIKSEALQYNYKKCMAEEEDRLRESDRKMNRDAIRAKVIIHCDASYQDSLRANKEYYNARQIQESVPHIIHSIGSRLNQVKNN